MSKEASLILIMHKYIYIIVLNPTLKQKYNIYIPPNPTRMLTFFFFEQTRMMTKVHFFRKTNIFFILL